jgi:transcriptional regulator with XRE-family HTH domain
MAIERTNKETVLTKNLQKYLGLNNATQKDVANAIGVSTGTFNDWVKGRAVPRMDKIQKLADYFDIEVSDLLEEHSLETKRYRQKEMNAVVEDLELNPELIALLRSVQQLTIEDRELLNLFVERLLKGDK